MAQTKIGAAKIRSKKLGLTLDEYLKKRLEQKWCIGCKCWHDFCEFGSDESRGDKLTPYCKKTRIQSRNKKQSKLQILAHRLIASRIRRGKLANPNTLKCMDCEHIGNDKRHEYDHYLGYDTHGARGCVQPVCSKCHNKRERIRGKWAKTQI